LKIESQKFMTVMMGAPKSGKSTYVDNKFKGWQIICADDIRLGFGFQFNSKFENFVWAVHDAMLRAVLERNLNVVIDSTNTTENKIKQYKTIADIYDYRFVIVLMRTSKEKCLKRNVGKGSVPIEVIEKMHSQMSEMLTSEFLKKYEVVYE